MPRRRRASALLFVLLLLALLALLAPGAGAQSLDDAVRRVGKQLQCPVCEGQSVADSNSGLAQDMRAVIRDRLAAGELDEQILDRFVAAYGDGILVDPPKRGVSLGVWIGPLAAFAAGAGLLAWLVMRWRRPATAGPPASLPLEATPLVAAELRQVREALER